MSILVCYTAVWMELFPTVYHIILTEVLYLPAAPVVGVNFSKLVDNIHNFIGQ